MHRNRMRDGGLSAAAQPRRRHPPDAAGATLPGSPGHDLVRQMASIWIQTKREKIGTIDGINLFFGALLGANLGTLDTLPLAEYVKLIALLVGLVMTIRLVSVSERRWYALATLALYVALLLGVLFVPFLQPKGLPTSDLHRLAATLGIWVVVTMLVEFYPTAEEKDQAG